MNGTKDPRMSDPGAVHRPDPADYMPLGTATVIPLTRDEVRLKRRGLHVSVVGDTVELLVQSNYVKAGEKRGTAICLHLDVTDVQCLMEALLEATQEQRANGASQ